MLAQVRAHIPSLSESAYKGVMGKLAVVGGSKEYTGAPYFSAISALHCGADLAHVLCSAAASTAIKSYSPDLIVHPILDTNLSESKAWIDRVHAVTFGPGLGTAENCENAVQLIAYCRQSNKPMVIDADAIHLIRNDVDLVRGYKRAIITPNKPEFTRLYQSVFGVDPIDDLQEAEALANELGGLTVVRKGINDVISDGNTTIVCDEPGSPRRCGGQGDLLSGTMLTFTNWLHKALDEKMSLPFPACVGAALAACTLTRRCSKLAYAKFGRSTLTEQMLPEIQHAFSQLFG